MPVDGVAGRARVVREQRRRGVEAERLGDRVPDDVDDDAGDRERRREADAERDHAHVLEARVGEQPLPGERAPEERDGDGQRDEPEADEDAARHVLADGGRRAPARSARRRASTAGRSAAESSARHGRRRLGVRVGQPVVHRRPADLGREAREEQHEGDGQLVRRPSSSDAEASSTTARRAPPSDVGAMSTMPSSANPSPSVVSTRYFQPASSAVGSPAEADEQRRGGGRRLDQQPGDAEVAGERHREQHGPERGKRAVVQARAALRRGRAPSRARRGRRARRARSRGRRAPITPTKRPPARRRRASRSRSGRRPSASATIASTSATSAGRERRPRVRAPAIGAAWRDADHERRDGRHRPAPRARATRG